MEEGKDLSSISISKQCRILPLKLLQLFLMFLVVGLGFLIISINMLRILGIPNVVQVTQTTFLPCFEKESGLETYLRPQSNLRHTMNDTELFWRASFLPRIKKYPFKRIPKIAFMFLTKGPLPLSPLWEKFFKGNEELHSIYIHSSPSYVADFPPSSVFYRRQIPSQIAEWGMMSMCDAERRLLSNALLDISNEWFILLSESCIPLNNFGVIYHYMSRSRYSFIGSFDEDSPFGRGRYHPGMTPEVNLTEWRKGSQWFEINRELAINIVEDITYYPKFKEFCTPACYVDEHYFPTMLGIRAPNLLANRSTTWVDWSRGGAHPATFGKADITKEFFKRILEGNNCTYNGRESSLCFLFARKFAPSSLDPLLDIAVEVFGF